MAAGVLGLTARPVWRVVSSGSQEVAVAERNALGTTARIAVWPTASLPAAVGTVDRDLARLDLAASRFRPDSELSRIHRRSARPARLSKDLAEAVWVALAAASWTNGRVDPTVGGALIALGYDRDFIELRTRRWKSAAPDPVSVPGWQSVELAGTLLDMPIEVRLDLGATAKGLGADWAARTAHDVTSAEGVLVSLGGDMATAGDCPVSGWPVLIADDHRLSVRSSPSDWPTQLVRLTQGAIATSSISCRQWSRAGQLLHHIVDPRTGTPADGPWRTVSVAAATCADANAAATSAIIDGRSAPEWLRAEGLAARLVAHDGSVLLIGDWPAGHIGQIPAPPPGRIGDRWRRSEDGDLR